MVAEIPEKEQLLTQDHRKKLIDFFKNEQKRTVRKFVLLYRASQVGFSSRAFYEAVTGRANVLVALA